MSPACAGNSCRSHDCALCIVGFHVQQFNCKSDAMHPSIGFARWTVAFRQEKSNMRRHTCPSFLLCSHPVVECSISTGFHVFDFDTNSLYSALTCIQYGGAASAAGYLYFIFTIVITKHIDLLNISKFTYHA